MKVAPSSINKKIVVRNQNDEENSVEYNESCVLTIFEKNYFIWLDLQLQHLNTSIGIHKITGDLFSYNFFFLMNTKESSYFFGLVNLPFLFITKTENKLHISIQKIAKFMKCHS